MMEELLDRSVVYLSRDEMGAARLRGKLIKIDQEGIMIQKNNGKRAVIPWQSFQDGGFILED